MEGPLAALSIPPPPDSGQVLILITELDPAGNGWQEHSRELPANEQERTHSYRYAADRFRFAKCRLLLQKNRQSQVLILSRATLKQIGLYIKA